MNQQCLINMNLNNLLTLSAMALGLVAAEAGAETKNCPSKKCTRELEAIVYQPEIPAKLYMDRITREFKLAAPFALWNDQEESFIKNFELKYGVTVRILSPFRNVIYPALSPDDKSYYSTTSTANMNGNGFAVDTDGDERIVYEFIVFNPLGEMRYVLMTLPLADGPAGIMLMK